RSAGNPTREEDRGRCFGFLAAATHSILLGTCSPCPTLCRPSTSAFQVHHEDTKSTQTIKPRSPGSSRLRRFSCELRAGFKTRMAGINPATELCGRPRLPSGTFEV